MSEPRLSAEQREKRRARLCGLDLECRLGLWAGEEGAGWLVCAFQPQWRGGAGQDERVKREKGERGFSIFIFVFLYFKAIFKCDFK